MSCFRSSLEVDTASVRHNLKCLISRSPQNRLMAVVKADAYGVGVEKISRIADEEGCAAFGVATVREALQLRELGIKKDISVLSGVLEEEISDAIRNGISLPLTDVEISRKISCEAVRQQRQVKGNLIIDSGMGRAGIVLADAGKIIPEITSLPAIECSGIYSHFSSAGEPDDEYTLRQISDFNRFLKEFALPTSCRDIHFAAFDGINNYSPVLEPPFTMARCGIGIYGMMADDTLNIPLEKSLRLTAKVVAVRELAPGTAVGYMHTAILQKPSRIAVVSFGYADGLPLAASNAGRFLVNGKFAPVVGRISMDYTTCDVTGIDVKPGDEAVIFGSSKDNRIEVSEVAALRGSHDYDVLCSVGSRTERVYI